MPERNRVSPFGEIVAIEQRGLFMGNRGSIHHGHAIVRPATGNAGVLTPDATVEVLRHGYRPVLHPTAGS